MYSTHAQYVKELCCCAKNCVDKVKCVRIEKNIYLTFDLGSLTNKPVESSPTSFITKKPVYFITTEVAS